MAYLSYGEVVPRLLREVPELAPAMAEHLRDNDELLPHVFIGDVTRYVHDELKMGRTDTIRRVLAVLEMAVRSPDQNARDLVGASFLENLESDATAFDTLSALAGPEMRLALANWRDYKGVDVKKPN